MIRIKPMTEATDVEPIEEPMMPMMEEAIPAEEPVMSREGYVGCHWPPRNDNLPIGTW